MAHSINYTPPLFSNEIDQTTFIGEKGSINIAWEEFIGRVPSEVSVTYINNLNPFLISSERSSITYQIERVMISLRLNKINISKPNEVRDYLLRYPDMVNFLSEICVLARYRFGISVQLSLEVYNDLETTDQYLTLFVRKEKYDEQILNDIEFLRAFYSEALVDKAGWLLITTDFEPPKKEAEQWGLIGENILNWLSSFKP